MPMDKSLLDKMQMPKKPGEEDDMLAFDESDMDAEGEASAGSMDLSAVPDEELLAELEKRGLGAGGEAPAMSSDEMDMEEAEA